MALLYTRKNALIITVYAIIFVSKSLMQIDEYVGTKCIKFMKEGHSCPFDGQCLQNSTCVLWGEGQFRRGLQEYTYDIHHSNCSSFDGGKFIDGHWQSACNFVWLSPSQMRFALVEKRFSFHGDSLVRQTFLRLISHIRGFQTIVEIYFHASAFYVFNETHDCLVIQPSHLHRHDVMQSPLFILDYNFEPQNWILDAHDKAVSLRFLGIHYWVHDVAFGPCDRTWLKAAFSNASVFCTTPDSQNRTYTTRNTWIKKYTNYLPLQEMSDTKVFLKNAADDTHFQCGFLEKFLKHNSLVDYKSPADGDCRDWMNLNLVMMLVHMSQVGLHTRKSELHTLVAENECNITKHISY